VFVQNNAEVRATGGLPGAYVVIGADRGAVRIVEQGTAATDLQSFETPVLPLDPDMRSLYTDRLGTYPGDVNFTPHFPTAAALFREMYRLRSGRTVDGVIATDPVALSYLLRATGPVPVPDGPALTSENAVRVLLSEAYARSSSNDAQDRYFAGVARRLFETFVGRPPDFRAALGELARAAGERRILVWSAHADEQRVIAGTVLEGALPTEDGPGPIVGLFLNDGSGSKLSYYLTQKTELVMRSCRRDGRRLLRLRVVFGSTAPTSGLSRGVLGLGLAGDPYTSRTNVLVFSPAGGAVEAARMDGRPVAIGTGTERGRIVAVVTVDLPPGGTRTVEFDLLTRKLADPSAAGEPRLWTTPTAIPWSSKTEWSARCR
jgi:hypothetical protein